MALHRLTSITVGVPNVDETAAYYTEFGLKPLGGNVFATADGGEQFKLAHAPQRRLLEFAASRLATGARSAIVVVGLHGIAGVNELYGTAAGDAVLVEAADRMRAGAEPGDVVARLAGNRFAVLTGCSALRAYPRAERLADAAAEVYELGCGPAHLTANAGVADLTGTVQADEALWHAATAADRAHARGPGRVEGYDECLAAALRRRATIEQRLDLA